MGQRGAYNIIEALFIDEGASFGTTPTTGAWLPICVVNNIDAKRVPTRIKKVGLGTQVPSDFKTTKHHWQAHLEHSLVKKQTTPAFNWKTFYNMLLNLSGSNVPQDAPKSFSFGYKLDLATDEFGWLKGGTIESYTIQGAEIDNAVKGIVDLIAHWGDYGITDYVSGTATRQGKPTTEEITFGECDLLYGLTSESSILSRLNSFSLVVKREYQKRGTSTTDAKLYREFPPVSRNYELDLGIDFDSRTEYEHFIDDEDWTATLKIPNASGGVQIALGGGHWLQGELPAREMDLLNLRLKGECTSLTLTDIA